MGQKIFTIISIITFFINSVLALLVFSRNRHKLSNVIFSLFGISIALWILTLYFFYTITILEIVLILGRLNFVFSILFPFFLLVFVNYFPTEVKSYKKSVLWGFLIWTILLSIITLLTPLIDEKEIIQGTSRITEYGSLYFLFVIHFVFFAVASLWKLFRKSTYYKGIFKAQIRLLIYGLMLASIFGGTTNIFLPLVFKNYDFQSIGPLATIFLVTSTSYAIVKHRLMDIRLIVARSVVYSLLLAIFAGFYAGAIMAVQIFLFPEATYSAGYIAVQIILALIIAFSFQPLRRLLTRVTDKIFFKEKYDAEELLETLGKTMSGTIILIELLYKTLDILIKEMRLTRGLFILLSDHTIYQTQSNGYKAVPNLNAKQLRVITEKETVIYDELEEGDKIKSLLRKMDASIAVTLKTETQLVGILFLGEKNSGDMFSSEDIQVLNILAPQVAVAIQNAKSYEEIQRFNVTLRAEVQRQTRKLQEANEHLKELDKAKDEFLSMASHQLRTPLTAIKGYLSMLLEGDAGEIKVAQYDFINEAFQGANRMVGLINDLLNVSRMETGKFFLEPSPVRLDLIVDDEIRQLDPHARDKHLYLKKEVKDKIPIIEVDETKIRQVIMNFIDNAVYYTKEGGVTVRVSRDSANVKVEVSDTGIGVPDKQKNNLFSKFFRAENARKVRPDGTGLGLYLAKKVVEDHGGELVFRSEEGKGSTFGFKMPIKTKLDNAEPEVPVNGTEIKDTTVISTGSRKEKPKIKK